MNIQSEFVGPVLGLAHIDICNTMGVASGMRQQLLNDSPRNTTLVSFQRQEINDEKCAAAPIVYVKIGKTRPGGWWDGELGIKWL